MKNDGYGSLIGLAMVVGMILFIIYIIFLVASAIIATTAAGGALWGGGTAIRNYVLSFKTNMIDSNKKIRAA